jgi:hypothetical protein
MTEPGYLSVSEVCGLIRKREAIKRRHTAAMTEDKIPDPLLDEILDTTTSYAGLMKEAVDLHRRAE